MKKDEVVFLEHILESIMLIENYTSGKSFVNFMESIQLQDSIIRRIEIIGEAVKNLPADIKSNYPEVPWKEIAGMRDVLIHDYFGIDLELTWQVVQMKILSEHHFHTALQILFYLTDLFALQEIPNEEE